MSGKSLAPTWDQKERLLKLIKEVGTNQYRDTKAALGFGRMTPFQRLSYTQIFQVIEMLESLKKERFGKQGEQVFDSHRQQTQPQQPMPVGVPERQPRISPSCLKGQV